MDGARFANAVAHLGCHPGDVTGRAGVDIISFGCVKTGGMIGEALVFFGDLAHARAAEAGRWRKPARHLVSNGRYQSGRIGGRWGAGPSLRTGWAANAAARVR